MLKRPLLSGFCMLGLLSGVCSASHQHPSKHHGKYLWQMNEAELRQQIEERSNTWLKLAEKAWPKGYGPSYLEANYYGETRDGLKKYAEDLGKAIDDVKKFLATHH